MKDIHTPSIVGRRYFWLHALAVPALVCALRRIEAWFLWSCQTLPGLSTLPFAQQKYKHPQCRTMNFRRQQFGEVIFVTVTFGFESNVICGAHIVNNISPHIILNLMTTNVMCEVHPCTTYLGVHDLDEYCMYMWRWIISVLEQLTWPSEQRIITDYSNMRNRDRVQTNTLLHKR